MKKKKEIGIVIDIPRDKFGDKDYILRIAKLVCQRYHCEIHSADLDNVLHHKCVVESIRCPLSGDTFKGLVCLSGRDASDWVDEGYKLIDVSTLMISNKLAII